MENQKQKVDKWITQTQYVDQTTGEIISKWIAENKYRVIKTIKHVTTENRLNTKTHRYEKYGIITYTRECGTAGRQTKLWEVD